MGCTHHPAGHWRIGSGLFRVRTMSRTTFYQKNYTGWPPVLISEYNDPDSLHWETRTQEMKQLLILKMGEGTFLEWADRLFPGDSMDEATWKQIFDLYEAKFRVCQAKDREAERHDWPDDPKHYKTNGVF